jgi:hypothetical protein
MNQKDLVSDIVEYLRHEADAMMEADPNFEKNPKNTYNMLRLYAKLIEAKFGNKRVVFES